MTAFKQETCTFILKVKAIASFTRLSFVGSAKEFGGWDLSQALRLECSDSDSTEDNETITWSSGPLTVPKSRFPLKLRFFANGHRSSPNTRPLIWDLVSRKLVTPPEDGSSVLFHFDPTSDDSDSGWVHRAGVGAFQLRIGQPPGSQEPLVTLLPGFNWPHRVDLYEAQGRDPAVPEGKAFAKVKYADMHGITAHEGNGSNGNAARGAGRAGSNASTPRLNGNAHGAAGQDDGGGDNDNAVTFLLNAQNLDALEFRIDVTSTTDGTLIARGFCPAQALVPLEGSISMALVSSEGLQYAGTFRAAFLVVTELPHPMNNLGGLQRSRWAPNSPTLDIGHRGSGASRVQGHSVRENTVLSFQKAASNQADFIEFDVHVTADYEVVVHHDFMVQLALGGQELRVALPTLRSEQLRSPEFAQFMITPTEHSRKPAIDDERARRQRTLKRTMTSAEDMFHSIFSKPSHSVGSADDSETPQSPVRAFLSDRTASLREAFRRTPVWLGFNIELKYPTEAEMAAMGARFYTRNHFVDAVLKVVLEEAGQRRVIFSSFDPDCATLLSLKQPRYPVLFLTCGGTKAFADPRMNSLEAAIQFAMASQLQGVVAEATSVLDRLDEVVAQCHQHGLFLFTWGDDNNNMDSYLRQKMAGVDAIIMDDVARIAKATQKKKHPQSLFSAKQLKSPASRSELGDTAQLHEFDRLSSSLSILAMSPVGSPDVGGW